ncbi:MAG: hypothetical protein H7329_19085 [Opitutaceae bacterium]|nr:hypothetical protein [Cytophagales bacterium]
MKIFKVSLILSLITLNLSVYGQDDPYASVPIFRNYVKLNITQLAMRELRVGYERAFSRKHSIGIGLAWKPAFSDQHISFNFLGSNRSPYLGANSYTLLVNYKYFLGQHRARVVTFLELKFMERYTQYENKIEEDNYGKSGYASSLTTGHNEIFGAMALFGFRTYLFPSKRGFIDFYTGIGYRNKIMYTQYKSQCYKCGEEYLYQVSDDSKPFKRTEIEIPTVHLGVDFGFTF